jgi:23S rRNA (uracil1939-C5)-methyltransferase
MVAGGFGLGRHEGQVVFVPQSAPGDRLLVEPFDRRRDFLRAAVVKVIEASPLRREPPCPYFASCGGCSMMHIQPHAQREAKREILLESLRRGGGVDFSGEVPVLTGPESGYRVKARFHVKQTRRGPVIGFHAQGTHRVVDVDRCLQISDRANRVLGEIRGWLAANRRRASGIESFELVESVTASPIEKSGETGRPVVHFLVKTGRAPARRDLEELVRGVGLGGLVVTEGGLATARRVSRRLGETGTTHRVAGFELAATVHAFFQANRFLADALVGEALPRDQQPRLGRVVDLYCGVGLFCLPLARVADRVVGVEISSAAVADARTNARRAEIANVTFREESAADYATREGFEAVDLVVADPPRAGLERAVVEALSRKPPKELRYVSCDPASLGRDAGRLQGGGLELARLVLLDLFPNTHHIESVATFRRR